MGKRKLAPDADVIDLTGPEWHGTDSAGASASLRQQEQAPRTSPRKAKRLRKDPQSSDVSLPEKRAAMFKKSCPKNILDRMARVMSQRFFMIDRRREGNELREEFKVLGSTGNVYTVTIGKLPSCDCPDASRGNHCKHILFIYLKVLQVPQSSGLWYQKALLTNELESIFTNAPLAPGVLAHNSVRNAYASATGKTQTAESSSTKRRVPGPEDSCPICYESMHGESEGRLTFCEECGNALHSECFEQWRRSAVKLTCVWCRAEWNKGDINKSSAGSSSGRYVNLGGVAGLSGKRDTSSYHRNWRKAKRWFPKLDKFLRLSEIFKFETFRPFLVFRRNSLGMNLFLSVGDTFTPLLHTLRIPTYLHSSPASGVMQRSQSTPNVGLRPTVVKLHQAPRRTKTSIDFLVAAPPSAIYKERCEDPFGLAGFFPPRPRTSDQEQSGWWRDESPEHDSEESKEMTNEDGSALGFQRVLFSTREEKQAETIIEDEDKLGVLSILTGKWPNWENEITEDHLHSPYTSDETCDDEAVRLAYERRRGGGFGQQSDNGSGRQVPERTNKLFYGAEEEEEASGSSWLG